MVKKSVLNKLSDNELENYLKEGNRFTPEAIQIALEILEERGRTFTGQEKNDIQQLIQNKKEAAETRENEEKAIWKDYITEDPNAIKLYSRNTLLMISLLFSTIPGSILLFINFISVKKYIPAIFTLGIGFSFFFFQNYVLFSDFDSDTSSRYNPALGIIILGAIILLVISVALMPKKLPYRPRSLAFPIVLAAMMMIFMYFNFQEAFSAYPVVSILRLLRNF